MKKLICMMLTAVIVAGTFFTPGVQVQATEAPGILPSVTITAPWDSTLTFTFTNVYETCRVSGGKVSAVYTNKEGTLLISRDVTGQYGGDMMVTTFKGNKLHKMSDLFGYVGATMSEKGKDGYLSISIAFHPEEVFGKSQVTYGNIKDYAVTNSEEAPTKLPKITPEKKQLSTPKGLKLTPKKATWNKVPNNNGYILKIMQGKKMVFEVNVKKNKVGYSFKKKQLKKLKKGKKYTFSLVAKGKGDFISSKAAKSKAIRIK